MILNFGSGSHLTSRTKRFILLHYRVDAEVVQAVLSENFRPKLVGGKAVAGICLIRLEKVRPKGVPKFLGIQSENSADRIAVEWTDDQGELGEGVYVPRVVIQIQRSTRLRVVEFSQEFFIVQPLRW